MYQLEVELEGAPETPNGSHGHWRAKAGQRKMWKDKMAMAIMMKGRPLKPLAKVHVTFTRFTSREPDYDNLVASFKGVRDGIAACGVVPDGSSKHMQAEYLWELASRGKKKIRVKIREVKV